MSKQEQQNSRDLNWRKLKSKKKKNELNKKIKKFKWKNNSKLLKNNNYYNKLKMIRKSSKKN